MPPRIRTAMIAQRARRPAGTPSGSRDGGSVTRRFGGPAGGGGGLLLAPLLRLTVPHKLSVRNTFRHRSAMPAFRYRHQRSASSGLIFLAAGAAAGVAAGVFLAQRFGGISGISTRLRDRFGGDAEELTPRFADEGYDGDLDELDDTDEALKERALEAYRNDPILSERAIDIGAIGEGIIELTGYVHADEETTHAVTLARGVPGVETVVNR